MEKISVSDLSVGDWVCAEQLCGVHSEPRLTPPMKVVGLGESWVNLEIDPEQGDPFEFEPSEIRGVPITAEVLEKNGWLPPREEIERDSWWWSNEKDLALELNEYGDDWYLLIISKNEEGWQYNKRLGVGLKHIHQLQRALRLAKVDKEIVI